MERKQTVIVSDLNQNDVFMWQNTLYRIVNISPEEHDVIRVMRLASFWSTGRGGNTVPTWVWPETAQEERFKANVPVAVVTFDPK